MLQSVGSSPGRPRWVMFMANFQGEKGSLATTWPVNLEGGREGGREGGGGVRKG